MYEQPQQARIALGLPLNDQVSPLLRPALQRFVEGLRLTADRRAVVADPEFSLMSDSLTVGEARLLAVLLRPTDEWVSDVRAILGSSDKHAMLVAAFDEGRRHFRSDLPMNVWVPQERLLEAAYTEMFNPSSNPTFTIHVRSFTRAWAVVEWSCRDSLLPEEATRVVLGFVTTQNIREGLCRLLTEVTAIPGPTVGREQLASEGQHRIGPGLETCAPPDQLLQDAIYLAWCRVGEDEQRIGDALLAIAEPELREELRRQNTLLTPQFVGSLYGAAHGSPRNGAE